MKKGKFTGWLTQVLPEKQMSEAFINSIFLAMSGGFQDAYTYFTRDKVFSNAQTGNVVLMSQHFMMGEWSEGLRYLFPLLAFAVGVFVAERIQGSFKYARKLHWRQSVLLCEMAILVFVGFLPENLNMAETASVNASTGLSSNRVSFFFLCHAGADIPESRRIFLREHNVHRKSAEWDGSVFTVSQGKKTGTDQTGTLLFWNHFILCGWCGNRRKSVCEVRVSCDLDIRWTSVDQFSADVLRKD